MPVFPELEPWLRNLRDHAISYIRSVRERYAPIVEKSIEWIPLREGRRGRVAAVDSSFVGVETRLFYVFVVQSLALCSGGDRFSRIARAGIIDYANLLAVKSGRVVKRFSPKNMLSFYAQALELESISSIAEGAELALLDGSIITFLMYRGRGIEELKVYRVGDEELTPLQVWSTKSTLLKRLARITTPVFVAKSSLAGFYTGGSMPDMEILEALRLLGSGRFATRGFSEPRQLSREELIRASRIPPELADSVPFTAVTVTYARFVDGGPIYQVTIPGSVDSDELREILERITAWSPAGYPLPLESVHKLSKLTKKAVRKLLTHYGVPMVSGREAIE